VDHEPQFSTVLSPR